MNGLKWKHPYRNENAAATRRAVQLTWALRADWTPTGTGRELEPIPEFLRVKAEKETK